MYSIKDKSNLGFYVLHGKRIFDVILAFFSLIFLSPIFLVLSLVGFFAMHGNPFFLQPRPGRFDLKIGKEKIFNLVKFRTMSNERDSSGYLLPDELRLNSYGRFLRSTSLDELPEIWNILKGDMSFVGPRPQLVRDVVFMTDKQRYRHILRPGLTGLAQVSGRNSIDWEKKLAYDLIYIDKVSFYCDLCIIFKTLFKVFKKEGINQQGRSTSEDYGDFLLENNRIELSFYLQKQKTALDLLNSFNNHQ